MGPKRRFGEISWNHPPESCTSCLNCRMCLGHMKILWLVVEPPLWKIWKSVGISILNIWENKNHVPNHQPVLLFDQDAWGCLGSSWNSGDRWPIPRLRWATARKAMEPWTEILDDPAGITPDVLCFWCVQSSPYFRIDSISVNHPESHMQMISATGWSLKFAMQIVNIWTLSSCFSALSESRQVNYLLVTALASPSSMNHAIWCWSPLAQ